MREQLEKRLKELQAEFESGQKMLADLDQQRSNLEKTLLRISGAMQVLEEELAKADPEKEADLMRNNHQDLLETSKAG